MHEVSLDLELDGARIPGRLAAPAAPWAALLLIPGSLWSDVDGNYPAMGAAPGLYKQLAEQLAASGVAVLRFAKTGPGTGTQVLDEERFRSAYFNFPQRRRVAAAWLDELARRAPGVPLFVAGHSEGAVVATQVARARRDVRGLVLLSGPALPLLRLMIWQQHEERRRSGEMTAEAEIQYARALRWLADFVAAEPLPPEAEQNPYARALLFAARPDAAPYLRSLEQVDPAAELAAVAQPVLIVQGDRDPSVHEANAALLQAAQPRAETARFPGLQHFYKQAPEGLGAQELFAREGPIDPAVSAALTSWLRRQAQNLAAGQGLEPR
ncbi:MAG: alpha/beta hydrolase [Terriglobales bacterium]